MVDDVIAAMKRLSEAGDYAGVEQRARAFLDNEGELPADRVAVLLHWSYSAGRRQRRDRRQEFPGPSALTLALQAVELARARLPASDRQRAAAEYQAGMCLHSAGRNDEAWEHVSAAYELSGAPAHVDTMLLSLYVEVALASGNAESALAPAKRLLEYERGRSSPTTLVLAMWLHGQCLAAMGNVIEGRAALEETLALAVKERGDPAILAEFQAAIDALEAPKRSG